MKEKIEATLEKLLDLKYNFHLEEDVPFPVDLEDFPVSRKHKTILLVASTRPTSRPFTF